MAPFLNASLSKAQKAFIVSGAFSSIFFSRVRIFHIKHVGDSISVLDKRFRRDRYGERIWLHVSGLQ
jgi:hypothetical protein